jgi:outer membrane protein OmpA-like peptidoglycan-associated protein
MILLLIQSPIILLAQEVVDKELDKAIKYISLEEYAKAKTKLVKITEGNPESSKALYYLGIAQLNLQENVAGKKSIEKALSINADIDLKYGSYWKGMAHYYNLETAKARESFNAHKSTLHEKSDEHATIDKLLAALDKIEEQKGVKPEYYIESLPGDVNTVHEDHSPLLSSDESALIFTSKNQESTDRKEKKNGEFFENIYVVQLDGFQPTGDPENLSASLNTDRHDASIQLFENDSKMLLYRINNGGDIYQANRENGVWSEPKPLGKSVNSNDYESSAFVMPDGKTMFFSSSRKSKNGTLNIYQTSIGKDGNWGEPVLLGPEVNSEDADEDCPFITNNGKTIYFSSKGHNSIGGYDIFVSHWNESEKKWSEAKNLGMPVNSVEDDMYFVLDKSSTHGYFSSFRAGGKGGMDIYYVGKILPVILEAKVEVQGMPDAEIGEVKVKLKDKQYGDEYQSLSDKSGKFNTSLDANSTYEAAFYSEDYKDGKEPFSTQTIEVPRTIKSEQTIKKSVSIPVSDYNKLLKPYQLNGTLATAEGVSVNGTLDIIDNYSGKVVATLSTNEGTFKSDFKSAIGKKFTLKVKSNGETFKNVADFTTSKDSEITKNIVVSFSEDAKITAAGIAAKASSKSGYTSSHAVLFDNNSVKLKDAYQKDLERVIASVKSGAKIQVVVEGYADNAGKASYNLKLSKKRAKEVAKYLMDQGLDKNSIDVKFYGEDNPVADNGTEAGRLQNRRVEIHIK